MSVFVRFFRLRFSKNQYFMDSFSIIFLYTRLYYKGFVQRFTVVLLCKIIISLFL